MGGSWRFSWRADRLRELHELGQAFGLTEDAEPDERAEVDEDQPATDEPEPGT